MLLNLKLILTGTEVSRMLSKFEFAPSENSKYGLYLTGVFVVCVLLYLGAIRPLNYDVENLRARLLLANTKLAQLQTFSAQTPDYDALLKIQKLKVEQAHRKIPDKISVPALAGEYSKLSEANGIALISLEPKNYIKAGTAVGLPLEMRLNGDYFRLITFLQQVENADRFVNLQSVKFGVQPGGDLDLTAQFIVYGLQGDTKAIPAKIGKDDKAKTGK